MRLTTLLFIFASAVIEIKAFCYTSGDDWGIDKDQANAALEEACSHLANVDYNNHDKRYFCVNGDSGNKKLEFWIESLGKVSKFVDKPLCIGKLGDEINGCSLGGESEFMSLYFRADPNPGKC